MRVGAPHLASREMVWQLLVSWCQPSSYRYTYHDRTINVGARTPVTRLQRRAWRCLHFGCMRCWPLHCTCRDQCVFGRNTSIQKEIAPIPVVPGTTGTLQRMLSSLCLHINWYISDAPLAGAFTEAGNIAECYRRSVWHECHWRQESSATQRHRLHCSATRACAVGQCIRQACLLKHGERCVRWTYTVVLGLAPLHALSPPQSHQGHSLWNQ